MAEQGPKGKGDGSFRLNSSARPRISGEVKPARRQILERSSEDSFKIERENAREARLNLMEACVAWEGVRAMLSDLSIDPLTARIRKISDNVAQLRGFLEGMQMFNNVEEITEELQMATEREIRELRYSTVAFKFDLGSFIDYVDHAVILDPRAKNFQKHEALTYKDYVDLNQELNILKRFANRRELIIDTSSKILRAETTPTARLATRTEPIPDSTSAPTTALPPDADLPAKAREPKAVADPAISTVSTASTGPTPAVATLDTTTAAGEPDPATATTPNSSAAAPDVVAGSTPDPDPSAATSTDPATEAAVAPDASLNTEDETSAKQERIRELLEIIPEEVFDALETIARSSELITANNLMKYAPETVTRENVTEIVNTITELERLGAL